MFRIALDAGHGLNTFGKRCDKKLDPNQTREWVLNSRICNIIEKELFENYTGFELLRVDDKTGKKDISLSNRAKTANNFKADFYLSIHHNAGIRGGTGGGVVVYTWKKPDTELQSWQKLLYNKLVKYNGLKGNRATPLSKANFTVLVKTNCQALLIENGFMDSATDVPFILTEEFAERSAMACVDFLVEIGKLKKKQPTKTFEPYKVRVNGNDLNIRKGAGTNTEKCGKCNAGVYTIVEERSGVGSVKGWGKLKSGAGWISLDYCTKL